MQIYLTWTQFKELRTNKVFPVNYEENDIEYKIFAYSEGILYICYINKEKSPSDTADFETYKDFCNQAECDKVEKYTNLQMIMSSENTVSGIATILIKIPGSIGEVRYIKRGEGWFESPVEGDCLRMYHTDEDNILGGGAGAIVKSYTDESLDEVNKGNYIPLNEPIFKFKDTFKIKSGLYFKVLAKKGDMSSDKFRFNLMQGEY